MTWRPSWTATVTPYVPASQRGLERPDDLEVRLEVRQRPLALERLEQPGEIAGRRGELRRRDLDVVEPDDRVDDERPDVEPLAHDLAVDLALRRDVDEDVAADRRRARQAPVERPGPSRRDRSPRAPPNARQVARLGDDPVLGELAKALGHLAAAADAAPAADRVDVHAERARRVEDRRPGREPPATTRRREDDEGVVGHGRRTFRQPTATGAPVDPAPADLALGHGDAMGGDPATAVGIVAHQDVGGHDAGLDLRHERVGDRRGHPGGDRHRQEGGVDPLAVRQAEADVRGAAGRVDAQLLAQAADEREDLLAGLRQRADRHDQRIDDDVRARDAVVGGALHDPLGDREPDVGVHADPGVVVADRDDRRAVLADERQDALQALLLAGHRVEQRLALVDGEAGLERLDDRGVDRQRQVGQALDELDGPGQDRRLVGERDPGVDVEHVGAGLDLGEDVALDPAEVAGLHLLGQELAPGRVDPLADDDERPVEADDDLAGGGADDGVGHVAEISDVVAGGRTGPSATPPDWISSARWCLS